MFVSRYRRVPAARSTNATHRAPDVGTHQPPPGSQTHPCLGQSGRLEVAGGAHAPRVRSRPPDSRASVPGRRSRCVRPAAPLHAVELLATSLGSPAFALLADYNGVCTASRALAGKTH